MSNVISLADEAERRGLWSHRRQSAAQASYFVRQWVSRDGRWHRHPNDEQTFIVTEGAVIVELRTGVVLVEEGEIHTIPPNTSHRICPVGGDATCLVLKTPDLITIFETDIGERGDRVR